MEEEDRKGEKVCYDETERERRMRERERGRANKIAREFNREQIEVGERVKCQDRSNE